MYNRTMYFKAGMEMVREIWAWLVCVAGWIFIVGCAVSCTRTCWNVDEGDVGLWGWCHVCILERCVCVKGGIVCAQLCVCTQGKEGEQV